MRLGVSVKQPLGIQAATATPAGQARCCSTPPSCRHLDSWSRQPGLAALRPAGRACQPATARRKRLHVCCSGSNGTGKDTAPDNGSKQPSEQPPLQSIDNLWETVEEAAKNAFVEPPENAEDERKQRSSTVKVKHRSWRQKLGEYGGRIAYQYFNWRKDTWSDLQLFMGINLALVVIGGVFKTAVVDPLVNTQHGPGLLITRILEAMYYVLVVVLGQEFPDAAAGAAEQLFSLAVAGVGLAAFALVLALTEQVVLEVLEDNVKRGSKVYEHEHVLVVAWADTQRDQEVIWKILSQICLAYRSDGGRTVVVLSQCEKLVMEASFNRILPVPQRFGTHLVFRQGSPLVPDDLRMVAASEAAATLIVSDSSRSPEEADAQAVRAAVLLDELDFPGFDAPDPRRGHIVVELKAANALPLLQYSCSKRVIALPTGQMNARRIARMVKHPVVGNISQMLWSFNSHSQGYLQYFPHLVGQTFKTLPFYFPDGIVFGLVNHQQRRCQINPAGDVLVQEGDELVMMRPTNKSSDAYHPLPQPVAVDPGNSWNPASYLRRGLDNPTGLDSSFGVQFPDDANGPRAPQCQGDYTIPSEYIHSAKEQEKVLMLGWGENTFMADVIRELDHGPSALPKGSEITLFNRRASKDFLAELRQEAGLRNLAVLQVTGNPLDRADLASKIDIARYKCVIVLCDSSWIDPDLDPSNGIQMRSQRDMLRLDSMIMIAQLGIRKLLKERKLPEINIICEKVAFEGETRFEDQDRLPLGISVNITAFAAKLLVEAAYNPRVLLPYAQLGSDAQIELQDSSAFSDVGEKLSFWQLQARVMSVGQVLFGYYSIPTEVDKPIDIVVNPEGMEARSQPRVWNTGDGRLKLVSVCRRPPEDDTGPGGIVSVTYGDGDSETARIGVASAVDDGNGSTVAKIPGIDTQPPGWLRPGAPTSG